MGKKLLKVLLIIVLVIVVAAGGLVGFLSATEYRPDDVEYISASTLGEPESVGDTVRLVTWNVGYCGLGEKEDFVMDGGTGDGKPEREDFDAYFSGVLSTLDELDADVYMLQEVDENSTRSYGTNEMKSFSEGRNAHSSVYALNYSCPFVPFPWPPIGKVNSGILTTSDYAVQGGSAERIALPCPFSWPIRTANLKRCLLVSRYYIPDLDKELVVVNLHLEAYDDGEGKAAQTAMLFDILESEYAKGNYVIAGGDFNQTFPGTLDKWPIREGEVWAPGVLEAESLPEGWSYVYDDSSPTCRLLDAPYDAETSQHYVLDGFIVSPNIDVLSVETQSLGFKYSDHNPVVVEIGFKEA